MLVSCATHTVRINRMEILRQMHHFAVRVVQQSKTRYASQGSNKTRSKEKQSECVTNVQDL